MYEFDPKKTTILFVGVRELIGMVDTMPPESNFLFKHVADVHRQIVRDQSGRVFMKVGTTIPRLRPYVVRNYQVRGEPEQEELEMYEEALKAAFATRSNIHLPKMRLPPGLAGPDGRLIDPLLAGTGGPPPGEG